MGSSFLIIQQVCQIPKKVHKAVANFMQNNSQTDSSKERREYLEEIADDFGVDAEIVFALADLLGPNEDHDGLISSLEDISDSIF